MAYFSVIIPLFNKDRHVLETLKSVIFQTFDDFEVIVVNDGSTDDSLKVSASIKDERIKIFTLENNGVSHARNFGISQARSEFMVLLDADDLWKPTHLSDLKILQQQFPTCGLYATGYETRYTDQTIRSEYYGISKQPNWTGIIDDFFVNSKINCIASCSSVMIPKTVFEAVGGFDTTYNSGEDIDLWIRIALRYQIAFTTTVSVIVNMNVENQVSQTSVNSRKHLEFNNFEDEEKTNKSLKFYLDLNRFSMAIQHKLAGNTSIAEAFIQKIDLSNLNMKQRFLLKMNTALLKEFLKLKDWLRNHGIGLSAFR